MQFNSNRMPATSVILLIFASLCTTASGQSLVEGSALKIASQLGFTPESLVLAKLEDHSITILSRIEQSHDIKILLNSYRDSFIQKANEMQLIGRSLASGDHDAAQAYRDAMDEYKQLEISHQQSCSDIRAQVLKGLPSANIELFQICRSRLTYKVPHEFMVMELPENEWKILERAIKAENRARRMNEELDSHFTELLSEMRANFKVIEAKIHLESKLVEVKSIFQQFNR